MAKKEKKTYLWQSRKRNFLGLPWSLTKYSLDEERLYINTGLFTSTEDEVRLYRITDMTLKRGLGQKLFGMGTIHCSSSDVTLQNFDIKNIKHSKEVKDMLSKLVDDSRLRNRVYTSESVTGHPHGAAPVPPHEIDTTDENQWSATSMTGNIWRACSVPCMTICPRRRRKRGNSISVKLFALGEPWDTPVRSFAVFEILLTV